MKKGFAWKLPLSLGCVFLGVLISLQFKTQKIEGFPLTNFRSNDLIRMVKDLEIERKRHLEELKVIRTQLDRYEKAATKEKGLAHLLSKELEDRRMEAGLLAVSGPGLLIVLNDSPLRPKEGEDNYFYIVHDVDIQQLVTELWAAGAEVVSINDERLVTNTAVRCVGPTILVNTVRLAPPYMIKAIGDPAALEASLKMRGGFLDAMAASTRHGVTVKIQQNSRVEIPAFHGTTTFKYAKPFLDKESNQEKSTPGAVVQQVENNQ